MIPSNKITSLFYQAFLGIFYLIWLGAMAFWAFWSPHKPQYEPAGVGGGNAEQILIDPGNPLNTDMVLVLTLILLPITAFITIVVFRGTKDRYKMLRLAHVALLIVFVLIRWRTF